MLNRQNTVTNTRIYYRDILDELIELRWTGAPGSGNSSDTGTWYQDERSGGFKSRRFEIAKGSLITASLSGDTIKVYYQRDVGEASGDLWVAWGKRDDSDKWDTRPVANKF